MDELTAITRGIRDAGSTEEVTRAWYRNGNTRWPRTVSVVDGHPRRPGDVDYITVLVGLYRLTQRGAPSARANAGTAAQWLHDVWGPAWAGLVDTRNAGGRHPHARKGTLVSAHGGWVNRPQGLPSRGMDLMERTGGYVAHHLSRSAALDLLDQVSLGLTWWLGARPEELPLEESVQLDAVLRETQHSAIAELLPQLAVDRLEWVTTAAQPA